MRKFEHLIYTERRSGIGMSLDGVTPPRTGYGVYSMSQGLLPSGDFRDRAFLETAVNMKNGSRPAGALLINSFAYTVPAGGIPMLGYYFQRDGSSDPSDRLASAYIDEWYFGELDCYPMDLFRADIWKAHEKSHTWYAEQAPVPTPYLNTVDADTFDPESLREEALRFARDGREETIRKAVWMLLKQMSLPLNERKYIVIRDYEENVRLWVAAILYQLPLQAALQVGFNTNVTGVNNPQFNVYNYNRKTGSSVKMVGQNAQEVDGVERRYQAMIVGVHPKDSSLPAGAAAQTGRNFVVIEGAGGGSFPVDEGELNRAYFRSMITRDADITNFFMDMNEMVGIAPDMKLPDLFDAQRILQAKDSWEYQSLVRALGILMPHFSNNGHAVLLKYVLKYLCCADGYGTRFAEIDAGKQLTLLRMLRKSAAIVNNVAAIEELNRIAYDYLKKLITDPDAVDRLQRYCSDLNAIENGLAAKLMRDLLSSGLYFLETVELNKAKDGYVEQIYKLLDGHIANEGMSWDRFWQDPVCERTLDRLAARAVASESLTAMVMQLFRGSRQSMERLLLAGVKGDGNGRWLCKLISGDVTLDYICSVLQNNGADPKQIEALLCGRMEQTGQTAEIQDAYKKYLSGCSDVGEKYYAAWLKQLAVQKPNVRHYIKKVNELLESVEARASDGKLLVRVLKELDASVTFEETEYNRKVVDLLYEWHQKCRFAATNASLWNFLWLLMEPSAKNRNLTLYERYICRNPDCDRFTVPEKFVRTPMCKKFLETALKNADLPEVQAVVLLIFQFDDKMDLKEYLNEWAMLICNSVLKAKGRSKAMSALYGLYDCYCINNKQMSRECDQLMFKNNLAERNVILEEAIRCLGRYLCEVRTDRFTEEIVDITRKEYGGGAAKGLKELLLKTQVTYRNNHRGLFGELGDKLAGLFGGNKSNK